MKPPSVRIYVLRKGNHVHTRWFVGPDPDHRALAGELCFRVEEWQYLVNMFAVDCEIHEQQ